ncbi:TetR/AcrR family transcriptional regulator [Streptomyces sp. SL13]|uniref:TetR/AcrR family transcriptional regulator n=1 Tax=Streptantibioticus silvisoli TaxID=2705255 RepID=A0AA90H8I8_9ACTN|nr:TetR/AcrR family transcriptional regulator [Streptantibioticus silvisoli]MDI5966834.1 TetR/AcrR family transcriptional regulator [Streptantibioticus silvisoli]MDI5973881.1 TetR/AcrR family transcriptional regulator [Streptantibioticus silvisoli]
MRTRARLRAALLTACAGRPLEEVGVAEVIRGAGTARATFYLHYDNLRELALDACADLVRTAVDALHTGPFGAEPPPAVVQLFTSIHERAALHRGLLGPTGGGPLGELLHAEVMARSLAERRRRLPGGNRHEAAASAVAAAFTGLLTDWLHGRVPGTPDRLAHDAWRVLLAIHHAFG